MNWLKKLFSTQSDTKQKLGDHEIFNRLIRVGLEDPEIKKAIFKLVNTSTDTRSAAISLLLTNLRRKQAPKDLIEAILSLKEEKVAESVNEYLTKNGYISST